MLRYKEVKVNKSNFELVSSEVGTGDLLGLLKVNLEPDFSLVVELRKNIELQVQVSFGLLDEGVIILIFTHLQLS